MEAERFMEQHGLDIDVNPTFTQLAAILEQTYAVATNTHVIEEFAELGLLRSVLIPGMAPKLLLNPKLTDHQKAFAVAREIGFRYLNLQERPYTATWVKVKSFEEVLNNFKASYFAGALLLNQDRLVQDIQHFFALPTWQPQQLLHLMEKYNTSPETLLHRLTSLLPKFFGIDQLFFLRFHHEPATDSFFLTKELHLSGLHNPHASFLNEHYCRRWISLTLFEELKNPVLANTSLVGIQRSSYINSDNEYLVLALAQPAENRHGTVSIGLLINENLRNKIQFLDDTAIVIRKVNETCERCPAIDCLERSAPPVILEKSFGRNK
ncbi:hypothetical protein GCM10028895_16360 [Pontibacter rugosus]